MTKKYMLHCFGLLIATSLLLRCGDLMNSGFNNAGPAQQQTIAKAANPNPDKDKDPQFEAVMDLPGVVGIGHGIDESYDSAVIVLVEKEGVKGIPGHMKGKKTMIHISGKIMAINNIHPLRKPAPGPVIDPTARFSRPVPIGVSIGNEGECSAGTLGARVKDNNGNIFILSNNHVVALENNASVGSRILQPGIYDASPQCSVKPEDVIGTLFNFVSIVFSTTANNTIDAGIAITSAENVGIATPTNGYGTPSAIPISPYNGMAVKKYGRTTSLTKATIYSIDYTVNVAYTNGTARFVHQILVYNKKGGFLKAGDSGSLLVRDSDNRPVGLLFAGDSRGAYSMANNINDVLNAFNVTIEGN